VEVSQAVTNCLFGALGALGSSQGTMNNLTFGNDTYQYYETICSGSPAGPGFDGTAAVHVHMTNSRLTDPEILETRFPVVLEDFHIRRGSGGKGRWNAGDGTSRTIRFLEPMDCAILSSHRRVPPFGVDGGEAGEVGQTLIRRGGRHVATLGGCDQVLQEAGKCHGHHPGPAAASDGARIVERQRDTATPVERRAMPQTTGGETAGEGNGDDAKRLQTPDVCDIRKPEPTFGRYASVPVDRPGAMR